MQDDKEDVMIEEGKLGFFEASGNWFETFWEDNTFLEIDKVEATYQKFSWK